MATNPFDLLGEDDTGDFECLLARAAAKQQEVAAAKQQEAAALAGKKLEVLQPPQKNEGSGRAQPPQQNEGSGRARERGWGRGRGRGGWGRGRGQFYDHRGLQEYDNGAYYGQVIGGRSQERIRRYDNRLPYYQEESFVRGGGGRYYDGEIRGGYYGDGERRWVERHRTAQVDDSNDHKEGTAKVVDPAGNVEDQSSESSSKLQTEQETCEAVKGRKEKTEENSEEEKADSENKKKNKSKDFSESTSEKQKPTQEDYANRLTLGEYEKVLHKSRKTLETMKPKERRVDPDQYIGLKIVGKSKKQLEEASESVQPKQRYEENKEKAKEEKRVSVPKVISINEFLKGYRDSRGYSQAQFGRSGMNGSRYWGQHNWDPASSRHVHFTGHVAPNHARYEGNYSNWHRSDGRYQGHNSDHDVVGHNGDKSNNGGTGYNGKMSGHGGHIRGYNREGQYHDNATYNEYRHNTSYNRGMHNNGSRFNGAKPINNGASYNGVGPDNNGTSYNGDRQGRNDAYYNGEKYNGYFVEDEPKMPAFPVVQVGPPPSIEDPKEFPTLPGVS